MGSLADMLYFDLLPDDSMVNIVRFLSAEPKEEEWPSHLEGFNVLTLCKLRGRIGSVTVNLYKALSVDTYENRKLEHDGPCPILRANSMDLVLVAIAIGGSNFRALVVRTNKYDSDRLPEQVRDNCPNIERISFSRLTAPNAWLEKLGDKINRLCVHTTYCLKVERALPNLRD